MTRHEKSLQHALAVLTIDRNRACLDAIYLGAVHAETRNTLRM